MWILLVLLLVGCVPVRTVIPEQQRARLVRSVLQSRPDSITHPFLGGYIVPGMTMEEVRMLTVPYYVKWRINSSQSNGYTIETWEALNHWVNDNGWELCGIVFVDDEVRRVIECTRNQ